MASVMSFSDIGCLNESAAGSLGAGIASFVNAGFPAARGFVITPLVFSEFIGREGVRSALEMFKSGSESPDEGWRTVKAAFASSRLSWSHEMEILEALKELDSVVSVSTSSRYGASHAPVYAAGGQDLLDAIKHCWVKWLRSGLDTLDRDMPAIVVKEVIDTEVSLELRRKGGEILARAVFGLPEGLHDPVISSDIYGFGPDGKLDRMEMRPQNFQYVLRDHGPSRVGISGDFAQEEKATGEMLAELREITSFMMQHPAISSCTVCFVSSHPLVCAAILMSDPVSEPVIPPRERSISLLEPVMPKTISAPAGPVIATRIFLAAPDLAHITAAGESYVDGVLVTGNILSRNNWNSELSAMAPEARRRLRSGIIVLELSDVSKPMLDKLTSSFKIIADNGMRPGVLIPGIRSSGELAKIVAAICSSGDGSQPEIWVRVMYPSNLFFLDSLAGASDVMALDLDSLAKLMLGGGDGADWLPHTVPALESALESAFNNKPGTFAIMSDDMISMPSMLEHLVRKGADIICVGAAELGTVKHIIASVEKRMLLEQGRK
jgi:hypothetical protein